MNQPRGPGSTPEASIQMLRARIAAEHRLAEAAAVERLRSHAALDA